MPTISNLPEAVSQRVKSFITDRGELSRAEGAEIGLLIDGALAATDGGKRLRARFCYTGWQAIGTETGADAIVDVASALEIFQAAALVHDDLIDNSDTRRGKPAAHRALEAAHRDGGWTGDAAAFGRSSAILLGDLLVAWSDDIAELGFATLAEPSSARREYGIMRSDVTLGQFLDVAQESAWVTQPEHVHAERALAIASLKSARYSVLQPIIIGASVADASPAQLSALRGFGHPVGIAFQLRDDVLGVFGDSAVTGKPAGDDLREGKRTLLVAYTREHLDGTALEQFDAALGDSTLTDGDVATLRGIMQETGALARVETAIDAYATEADGALESAPLESAAVADLRALASAAITRSA